MLTISKALSAGQAQTYHSKEFASEEQNYWSKNQRTHTEWRGGLAEEWDLKGSVGASHFAQLSEGQHPETGQQLIKHQPARTYENEYGRQITSSEHRAGWDATFSAPKSVSLTALVGGDDRIREAHHESVRIALTELERYTQARMGNTRIPETTGKFIAATFEHDTARPVEGYAAPQLHTHAVIFNVTVRENGQARALQERSLFQSQHYVTSVYRSELALRLKDLGYTIERGKYGQPEIKGYTQEYLNASSPRREQIKEHLQSIGMEGAGAAQVAAHRTRDQKELLSPEDVLKRHRELSAQYGHQPDRVVAEARKHGPTHSQQPEKIAQQAVTYARSHVFERAAVRDERMVLHSALDRGMGQISFQDAREELQRRVKAGEFRILEPQGGEPGRRYSTAEMIWLEKETIARIEEGNRRGVTKPPLVRSETSTSILKHHPEMNSAQRTAVSEILNSREQVIGLDGRAGAGKTTTLSVVREATEAEGYRIEGFAPTSRAAQKLAEAGIETSTLQRHLALGEQPDTSGRRFYILDESSLASTKQMHAFVSRLKVNDRVLLVGDTRQHESVEAGRPFAQLQEHGIKTVQLDEIVRQRDPALKQVVEQLAQGDVTAAVAGLERQGRVIEMPLRADRIAAIAHEYVKAPGSTLVISPDNRSRTEINERIRKELQEHGAVSRQEHQVITLVSRQDLTGADRSWAQRYQVNDVLRYSRTSDETGIKKGEYTRVTSIDTRSNLLTVLRVDGSERTYDPRRHTGVSVYRDEQRAFSVGDRVQFTAPNQDLKIANRELGTIKSIDESGRMAIRLESGRDLQIDPQRHPHLDHGYAVTSYSGQGQTADRVLIHVDTDLPAKDLLNNRMAYVAVSRGASDAQIFTNDRSRLAEALSRDVSHESAYKPEKTISPMQQEVAQSPQLLRTRGMGVGIGS
ncbi:MobF family relaxase [Acidicapsa dinghuensis]|uniref:MobF family relaxase n=1 Tax=Acidicapsa dinghuensis TaxID=2218256 RepID=A0ABW1EL33_9BACT|nr:MobF family relaxase [Acidicapsa dinghuensis]